MTTTRLPAISVGAATHVGGRSANADAVRVVTTPLGAGAAVVDGIGSSPEVCEAARLAADVAATVAAHRGAQAGIMAAADVMPDHDRAPNAVAAVVSVDVDGRIEIAHVGDAAVHIWSRRDGLRRMTADQTVGAHIAHMLTNPAMTKADAEILYQAHAAVDVMGDYVLNGLKYATINTVSWTPLRGDDAADVELILLTSDGIHKSVAGATIAALLGVDWPDPQRIAQRLVDAAVRAPRADPDAVADNATAAVLLLRKG